MIKALGMSWTGDEADAHIAGGYSCTTVPYDASIYSATADSTVLLAGAATVTDYSHTVPGAGTSFAVSSQTSVTANDGTQRTRVVLSVTPPAANRTHIVFAVYPAGSAVSIDRREIEITSGSAHTMSFDLTPGSSVDYQAVMLNHNNVDGKRSSSAVTLTSQTVAGDTSAPSAFSAIAVRKGTGKQVEIEFTGATPSDWSHVDLYRHTSDASGSATVIKSGKKKDFHDDNVSYGSTYYYWGKVVDFTGNASAFSPSSSHSIAVTKVGTTDIADDAIDTDQVADDAIGTDQVDVLNASVITAGTISASVNMSANSINVAGSTLTVSSGGVRISATGDSAINLDIGTFAKIKWWTTAFSGTEVGHIGAGTDPTFNGVQLMTPSNSAHNIRLGSGGAPFTDFGLVMTGNIASSDEIFDGGDPPPHAATGPERRIKIVNMTSGALVGYIWCEGT